MNHSEFLESIKRTKNPSIGVEQTLINSLLGLSGETGEVLDLYKKHLYQGHDLDLTKVMNEVGDVLYYLYLLAHNQGFTIEECMLLNKQKLEKRYPDSFSAEKSIRREI